MAIANLDIRVGRPWGGLGGAYARGEPGALCWYPGDWRDPEAWRERARQIGERFDRGARERAVACLYAPNDDVKRALDRVVAEGGFLVTTGQQPGLFTGPLYTLHKAISAIALARWLEPVLEVPVVPVFWTASEDHDWAEVDHADLIGVDNELHRLRVAPPAGAGELPLHRLRLGSDIESALEQVAQLLPPTEFTTQCLKLFRGAWRTGVTLPEGVRDTLAGLLGGLGLAFVDAADPGLKRISAPVLEAALRGAEAHERAVATRTAELAAGGWPVQVAVLEGGVNLFAESATARERLYREDGGFRLRHAGTHRSLDELLAGLVDDPGCLSPNVLLRPVVEAAVLPTVGYVAGPAESAYLAEVGPLFASHGIAQPMVFPRFSVMMVERKIGKVLEKIALEPTALARPLHEIARDVVREGTPEEVRRALDGLRAALEQGSAALLDAARPLDPTLKGPIDRVKSVAMDALADAERKIDQAVKRQSETTLQQIEKARVHLYPDGVPQERISNPVYFLARYGNALVGELLELFLQAMPSGQAAGSGAPVGTRG
ncbi:MAG: bacillithiol biosynthesis cysteine-adding enzyme BshC [Gemmatimonadetes bacterium]|nr:bacillithiol biosynthesis cysteine-adding enzyme BshC [Gemmatimonadota bacterium]